MKRNDFPGFRHVTVFLRCTPSRVRTSIITFLYLIPATVSHTNKLAPVLGWAGV